MINKNFGKLDGAKFEYAPNSFKTQTGVIICPPREIYLAKGYYDVIDVAPQAEPGHFVKFDRYDKDDQAKTITFVYVQEEVPETEPIIAYSKLRLEESAFRLGRSQQLDDFIDNTMISNEFGQLVSIRKFYNQATILQTDNDLFNAYLSAGQVALGLDDQQLSAILEYCRVN